MYAIYGLKTCGFCSRAIKLLQEKGAQFSYYPLDEQQGIMEYMKKCYNHKTVPMVIYSVNGEEEFIGGYDDLVKHIRQQEDKESN
tara:strand:+ start:2560 stop:2814 length:255 start_codon:yes stop_codon:yes gene_type:complete